MTRNSAVTGGSPFENADGFVLLEIRSASGAPRDEGSDRRDQR